MASSPLKSFFSFLVIFSLLATIAPINTDTTSGSTPCKETETHLHFYFHESYSGPGATASFVAGLHKNPFVPFAFGDIGVFDDALREGPDPSSKLIGRAQGMTVFASMEDSAILALMNLVFVGGGYNGSTIAVVGRVEASGDGDRPIVGGSGKFHLARGHVTSKLISVRNTTFVLEFDVYVTH